MCETEQNDKKKKPTKNIWVFDSILVLFEKCSYFFHHRGFYGTDHEKSDGRNLIFQLQLFVMCKKRRTKRAAMTLQTNSFDRTEKEDGVGNPHVRRSIHGVGPSNRAVTCFQNFAETMSCNGTTVLPGGGGAGQGAGSGKRAEPSTFEWFVTQNDTIGRCKIHSKEALP